jgi:hypothetical protein
MGDTCPQCGKGGLKRIATHFQRSPACARLMLADARCQPSTNPTIPTEVRTGPTAAAMEDGVEQQQNLLNLRHNRRQRVIVNYSEAVAKRVRNNLEEDCYQSPDEDLVDYNDTFFDHTPEHMPLTSRRQTRTNLESEPEPEPGSPYQQDLSEMAADAWLSIYGPSSTNHSLAAIALPPSRTTQNIVDLEGQVVEDEPSLGQIANVSIEQQNSRVVATPQDRSMARIYRICDQAGSPRYLTDSLIQQLRKEIVLNGFDPCHPGITQRDAFMHRASKSVGSTPPEAIPITLESGQTVTVYRFPFLQTLQEHLLSKVFSDLNNLSVDPQDPWGCYSTNGVTLKDAHDGTCYRTSFDQFFQSTPNPENYCFSPLMGYIDKTGTDGIEKNSLEPWMWISTCIRQGKREDSRSWFPGGFVPNLTMISAASRRGQKGRQYTKSAAVRDYHRCLEVLLQPLKDLQRNRPVLSF